MAGMQKRKLLKLDVEERELDIERRKLDFEKEYFEKEHMEFINSSNHQMCHSLGLSDQAQLNHLTKSPYITLKTLMSLFRRMKTLVEYGQSGKAHLLVPTDHFNPPARHPRAGRRPKKATSKNR
jgi:hypothetical protein